MKVIIVDGCVALQGGLMKSTGQPAPPVMDALFSKEES